MENLADACHLQAKYELVQNSVLKVQWNFPNAARLTLLANLGSNSLACIAPPDSPIIYASESISKEGTEKNILPAWSVIWSLAS